MEAFETARTVGALVLPSNDEVRRAGAKTCHISVTL